MAQSQANSNAAAVLPPFLDPNASVKPDNWTGYTSQQQVDFRTRVQLLGPQVKAINGVEITPKTPLLWVPALRDRQLQPGYDYKRDPVYQLSFWAPPVWDLVRADMLAGKPPKLPEIWVEMERPEQLRLGALQAGADHSHPVGYPQQLQGVIVAEPRQIPNQYSATTPNQDQNIDVPAQQQEDDFDLAAIVAAASQAAKDQMLLEEEPEPSSDVVYSKTLTADIVPYPPSLAQAKGKRQCRIWDETIWDELTPQEEAFREDLLLFRTFCTIVQ
ncbi:hypothetical protein BDW02DRAFT_244119 [Decorospora gaudefroyi]|uniref:Uncharacterized protein n=1 Tax=Decorospora gaudefroyi TaxID=184978 RepID=A0A6A5KKM4_9PLEO|nr:hypothetical protein BDW02DRAFT_244119 [Decorospora gaudefroyi]